MVNQIDDNVKVAVRVRRLNAKEISAGSGYALVVHPETGQIEAGQKAFAFNKVFSEQTQQSEVYEHSVKPLVTQFLDGYNATILAYGQTGSGKTYTMGTSFDTNDTADTIGIIPRLLEELLEQIQALQERRPNMKLRLSASYLEIYNEHIRDLLFEEGEEESRRTYLMTTDDFGNYNPKGITEKEVAKLSDLAEHLALGAKRRTTASTNMNSVSSRSHAIFTLRLEQTPLAANASELSNSEPFGKENASCDTNCVGKTSLFRLVDLAGSERSKKTGAEGERLREANNINKSLTTLGMCITKLASKEKHIPYRSSKLTHLLQNSLGGNSATLMIACVSPSDLNFEETMLTLRYANTASSIENKPVVNADPWAATNVTLRSAVAELSQELARVYSLGADVSRNIIDKYQISGSSVPFSSPPPSSKHMSQNGVKPTNDGLIAVQQTLFASRNAFPSNSCSSKFNSNVSDGTTPELEDALHELAQTKARLASVAKQGSDAYDQLTQKYAENASLVNQRDKWRWRFESLYHSVITHASSESQKWFEDSAQSIEGEMPDVDVPTIKGENEAFNVIEELNAKILALKKQQRAHSGAEQAWIKTGAAARPGTALAVQDVDESDSKDLIESEDHNISTGKSTDENVMEVDEGDEEDVVADAAEHTTTFAVQHIAAQAELKGKLDHVSDLLRQKERLLQISMANAQAEGEEPPIERYQKLRNELRDQLSKSEQEVHDLETRVEVLTRELEEAREVENQATANGKHNTQSSATVRAKDSEIKSLQQRLREMQQSVSDLRRRQKQRDRELERLQQLHKEVEQHKREKVELERRIRDSAKKFMQERKEREKEAIRLAKDNRKAKLQVARQKAQIEMQEAQLRAARQRERTRAKADAMIRAKRMTAASTRAGVPRQTIDETAGAGLVLGSVGAISNVAQCSAPAGTRPYVPTTQLLGDTENMNERAASLVRACVEQIAEETKTKPSTEFEQAEGIFLGNNGENSVLAESGVLPRELQDIVTRTVYYRNQKMVWKQRADIAIARRASVAERVALLEQQMEELKTQDNQPETDNQDNDDDDLASNTIDDKKFELQTQIDALKRELAYLTLRIHTAHAQRLSFEADEEREGLRRNGWMARVMEAASRVGTGRGPRRGRGGAYNRTRKSDLAGRLLNWFMLNIMKYNIALHGEEEEDSSGRDTSSLNGQSYFGKVSSMRRQVQLLEDANDTLKRQVQRADTRLTAALLQTSMDYETKIAKLRAQLNLRGESGQHQTDGKENKENQLINQNLAVQVEDLTEKMQKLQEECDRLSAANLNYRKQMQAPRSFKRLPVPNISDTFVGSDNNEAITSGIKREGENTSVTSPQVPKRRRSSDNVHNINSQTNASVRREGEENNGNHRISKGDTENSTTLDDIDDSTTNDDDSEEHNNAGGFDCVPSIEEIHMAIGRTSEGTAVDFSQTSAFMHDDADHTSSSTDHHSSEIVKESSDDEFDTSEAAKQRIREETVSRATRQGSSINNNGMRGPRSSVFQATEASKAKVQNKRDRVGYKTKAAFGTTVFVETDGETAPTNEELFASISPTAESEVVGVSSNGSTDTAVRKSTHHARKHCHRRHAGTTERRNSADNAALDSIIANSTAVAASVLQDMAALKSQGPKSTLRHARAVQRLAHRSIARKSVGAPSNGHIDDLTDQENKEPRIEQSTAKHTRSSSTRSASPVVQKGHIDADEFSKRILRTRHSNE